MSEPIVSDPTDKVSTDADLDSLVQKASTPSLATLFQRGKDAGVIKPGETYGST